MKVKSKEITGGKKEEFNKKRFNTRWAGRYKKKKSNGGRIRKKRGKSKEK